MALTSTSSLPRTRSGRTFFVALTVLGGVGLVQLLVLAGYLIGGGVAARRVGPAAAAPTITSIPMPPVPVVSPAPMLPLVGPTLTPAPVNPLVPPLIRPTPAPIAHLQGSFADLLEQARQLRTRGDMNSALARLREAQVAEPDNAQIISEMALTYEAMQMPDRAFEQWQRLANLGEGVGALYALAKIKLQSVPGTPAPEPAKNGENGTPASQEAAAQGQSDAILKLTDIHLDTVADPAAEQKIALKIVVKNRPGTAVDPTKVRILTYFYDLVDGKDIVLTDAQTAFAWLTPGRIDWSNDKSEVLETTYTRPKATPAPAPTAETPPPKKGSRRGKNPPAEAAATPTPTPAPVRTYLGYTVRLYYDRQLQDVQADPVRLLEKFPPQMTLPAE